MAERDDELARAREDARRAREEAERLRNEARSLEHRLREEGRRTAQHEREIARSIRDEARRTAGQFMRGGPHGNAAGGRRDASSAPGEQTETSFSLEGVRAIAIKQTAGSVTVRYCGEGETPGVASTGKSAPQLEVRREGDRLRIELKISKGWLFRSRQGPTTVVRLHPGIAEVNVSVGYGDLQVRDLAVEHSKLSVGAGTITTYSTTGTIEADVGAGKITLNVHRGRATCDTGTGDLMMDIAEVVPGEYKANVGMGRVEVRLPAGAAIQVEVASGIGKARNEFGGASAGAPSRLRVDSGIGEVVVKVRDPAAGPEAPPAGGIRPQRPGRASAAAGRRRHEADERRILQMLEQGRISSQDAADLIAALQGTPVRMTGDDREEAPDGEE